MPSAFPPLPKLAPPLRRPFRLERLVMFAMLGIVLGGLVLASMPLHTCPGPIRSTRSDMRVLRSAIVVWMVDFEGCPRLQDLERSAGTRTKDTWGHAFVIDCRAGEPRVVSAGPDGVLGTSDDLEV